MPRAESSTRTQHRASRDRTQLFAQRVRQLRQAEQHGPTDATQEQRPTLYTIYAHNPRQQALLSQRSQADAHWFNEARRVRDAIVALTELLTAVRRPYLAPPAAARRAPTTPPPPASATDTDGLADARARWGVADRLSDSDRDQVDTHVRLTIKNTMDCISELENAERVRQRTWVSGQDKGLFSNLLSSSSKAGGFKTQQDSDPFSDAYSRQLAEVRFAICACLSEALAAAGNKQRNLQEARLAAQQKRLALSDLAGSSTPSTSTTSGSKVRSAAIKGATRTLKSRPTTTTSSHPSTEDDATTDQDQGDALADTVSPEQALLFDSENAALLSSLQSDLAAVEATEQKLRDISELQTQLIQHLGQQNEMTTMLLDDSQAHSLEVSRGNEQLRQAEAANRKATKWLCMFLVGSGCGMLFLHCMFCLSGVAVW